MPKTNQASNKTQSAVQRDMRVALAGEIILRDENAQDQLLCSPGAQTCVILVLIDRDNPKRIAIGHFDTSRKIEKNVNIMLDHFKSLGTHLGRLYARLIGGIYNCFANSSSIYGPIQTILKERNVKDIHYTEYSSFVFWCHSYDVIVDPKVNVPEKMISVASDRLDVTKRIISQSDDLAKYRKRMQVDPFTDDPKLDYRVTTLSKK